MNFLNVKIATPRLLLLPISMKYKEEIFLEFSAEITKYVYPRSPTNISETEAFINDSIAGIKNATDLGLVILNKDNQDFLGCAGIHGSKRKDPELGIWLKKAAHGHKYGPEAITAIKNWAEQNLDYNYLRYPVDKANIASRKIPEALGGNVVDEYDKINMSGNILHIIEYRIYKLLYNNKRVRLSPDYIICNIYSCRALILL